MTARFFLILCVLGISSPVLADATVVVLGIRSLEGDDEFAKDLTEQLRGAAKTVPGWAVSSAAVSMSQMTLAHGCDDIDAACLSEIAKGLSVERVIYGTVRRNSTGTDYDYVLSMSLYDAEAGKIMREVDDTIPQSQIEFNVLATRCDKLMARLASNKSGGTIVIHANVPDAAVVVNGQAVGSLHEGELKLEDLASGEYQVEIKSEGYAPSVTMVSLQEGAESVIEATLASTASAAPSGATAADANAKKGGHDLTWLGWSLIGLGGASAVGWVVSLVEINRVNNDALYRTYSNEVDRGNKEALAGAMTELIVKDPCDAATKNKEPYRLKPNEFNQVVDMCNTAGTFEVLQWVFLGTAVAAGTAGTLILLTADDGDEYDSEEASREPALALSPKFGPNLGYVAATLHF
jgi:hypothetical protein